jgi:DNA segregation ATPase FtsK/SpoIIIE, S-DNA-T family
LRQQNAPLAFLSPDVKRTLLARIEEIAAYGLMGLAFFAGFALLSWQALDPSLSVSQDLPIKNWLGRSGANFADFHMQLFGLASLPLFLTLGFWGYDSLRQKHLAVYGLRLVFLALGLICGAIMLGCLPRLGAWPLNTSLGGALGDTFIRLFAHFTGELSGLGKAFLAVPMAIMAAKSLMAAWVYKPKTSPKRKDAYGDFEKEEEVSLLSILWQYLHFKKQGFKEHINERMVKAEPRLSARPPLPEFTLPEFPFSSQREAQTHAPYGYAKAAPPEADYEDFLPAPAPRSLSQRPEFVQHPENVVSPATVPEFLERDQPLAAPPARPRFQGFDPRKDYEFPSLDIMADVKPSERHPSMSMEMLQENARMLEGVLDDFGVRGEIINVRPGPVVTLYELEPAAGVKSSRVIGLADDIARSMSAISARVAVVPGRNAIGIECPPPKCVVA